MNTELIILIGLMAFFYSSVGHGGASGYLAVMALYAIPSTVMKPTSLVLNIFVSLISFIGYYRAGHFSWKKFFPFAIASIPMSYIGGIIDIEDKLYKIILGIVLILATVRLIWNIEQKQTKELNFNLALIIGAAIGFLSGLLGIGVGIILSPVMLLLGWGSIKETAAVSALFILVNSVAGLLGKTTTGVNLSEDMQLMIGSAIIGGLLGSYFGVKKFNYNILKYILALVLIIASIKLIFT
jgi:uncharacterized protein